MLQAPGRGTCHASYLSTWYLHWLFYYRSHFQIVLKKSGGCGQHQSSWSERSFSRRKLRIICGGSPFKTLWPIFMTQLPVFAKSQWEKLGNGFFLFFFFCLLLMGWVSFKHVRYSEESARWACAKPPTLDSAPVVLLSARHQAQSAPFVLCHQLPLLLGIIASPWLDASIF